ncbi:MAG: hypothetical protein RRB12_09500, partial [Armatimonadota bacterium]|nr:hypothetical protein [Armatimonadota bacterium]
SRGIFVAPAFAVLLPAFCRPLVYFSSTCRLLVVYLSLTHALLLPKLSGRANLATNPALMGR